MPIKVVMGGVFVFLVGWVITGWYEDRDPDALDALLAPLGVVLTFGGILILLVGILWLVMLTFQRWAGKT
jgi:biotin transporter BioY